MTYTPILKGKPGELKALEHASGVVLDVIQPVLEVVPKDGIQQDCELLASRVLAHGPSQLVWAVDTGFVDGGVATPGGPTGVAVLDQALADGGFRFRPVVRAGDDAGLCVLASAAHGRHGQGVCLRLGSDVADPDPIEGNDGLAALASVGLSIDQIHLVLDYQTMSDARDVLRATPTALAMLAWAGSQGPWASVALVSGAFPDSISLFPKGLATPVDRLDAEFYDQVITARPAIEPHFGDFAISHPSLPQPVPRGPLPNLRYTDDRQWLVFREAKALPGNESFFTLCGRLAGSASFSGPSYSWGDAEIGRCATSSGGAGTATEWRAIGTSHHLQMVTDRLATLGVP